LKRAILRKRPYHDALETVDVVRGDNNNNNNNNDTDDDNSEDVEYPITLRANINYNTMKCEIRYAYRINFGKPNSIGSLLGFSSKRILRPRR